MFNKQNIFWKKKFAILNCTRFLSHPTAHYKENKFFWIVHTRRTKIIEKDIGTPHTPYFRLSQMYYNRYMPGFASVPTDKALKKNSNRYFIWKQSQRQVDDLGASRPVATNQFRVHPNGKIENSIRRPNAIRTRNPPILY